MGDHNNIIVGAASLSIDSVDVGFTQGGVSLRKATDFVDVDADQLGGVARKVATFERMFLSTTLLEATHTNLQKLLNEPTDAIIGSQLNLGSSSPAAQEHTLTVTGEAPDGGERTYTFYRAISVDEVEHLIGSRDAPGVIPVGFELLKDPDNGNRFGFSVTTTT